MLFKELNLDNLNEVLEFYIEAFNAPPWNDKWTKESARKRLIQMINCEESYGLICYDNNRAVGMILGNKEYYYDCIHFNIKEFCIDNNRKGMGLGKIVLNEFTKRLKEQGVGKIYLITSKTEKTEGFYLKNGYSTLSDTVMMEKEI